MKPMKLSEVVHLTGGVLVGEDIAVSGVVSDSRKVFEGALFVALLGARVDGHDYVEAAYASGARAVMVTRQGSYPCPYILVEDVVESLARLARGHLSRSQAKIIAITGSVGKTSAKEMTAAAIASQLTVYCNPGNLNTEVGLPLSVLEHAEEEVLVLEMGMRGLGQIAELTAIAPPDIAMITNIGEAHLEILGNRDNIAKAKGEILSGMKTGGIAILNRDDDYYDFLAGLVPGPVISFGVHQDADFRILDLQLMHNGRYSCLLATGGDRFMIHAPWPGRHNVFNAVAALAAASAVGVDLDKAVGGLARCLPGDRRLDVFPLASGVTVIDDTYNASPVSTLAALKTLEELKVTGRRLAVLGNMYELGSRTREGHLEVGRAAAEVCDLIITVGELAATIAEAAGESGARVKQCLTNVDAIAVLTLELQPGDAVLVKGSRGMQMEEIVANLRARGG
jgi:UDP-N-acetylmuramoyl-tripeptide--D-alanyl-D-alanine ligase